MPLTAKGETIKSALVKEYGKEKGEQVLYAGKNAGRFTGIDCARLDAILADCNQLERRLDALAIRHDRIGGEFRESDHPRDADGKFAEGAGAPHKRGHESTKIENGNRVTASGGALPAHIQSLKIPPAWTDVTFNPSPDADLLVTGRDAKGRVQAIYSRKFAEGQAAAKFARIHELDAEFQKIETQNEEARKSDNARIRDSADALRLIMQTGIRPGSDEDTKAKVKAYGATTLEGRHVVETSDGMRLRFIGKKGVALDIPVHDRATAAMLKERAARAGADGKLFSRTNAGALLEHTHSLDGGGFKTKDFRTLLGTRTAMQEIARHSPPKSESSYKKAVMAVAKVVSARLGNTPVVALQSYINPVVFAQWRNAYAG